MEERQHRNKVGRATIKKKATGIHISGAGSKHQPVQSGIEESADRISKAIEKDLPRGTPARNSFDQLCTDGCDPKTLFSLLLLAVTPGRQNASIYDLTQTSAAGLRKLPNDIEQVAERMDRANRLMGMYFSARFTDNEQLGVQEKSQRRNQATFYRRLPEILKVFAANLRFTSAWIDKNVGPKRVDALREGVVRVVDYVISSAETAHYDSLVDILDRLYSLHVDALALGKSPDEEVPAVFHSALALRQLYLRWVKRGLVRAR